jgi:hypothetical protein
MTNILWPDFVRLQEDAIFDKERAFNIGRLDASSTLKVRDRHLREIVRQF